MAKTDDTRNRRVSPKGILEREEGKKLDFILLPSIHKVQIMEFLLTLSMDGLEKYLSTKYPSFVANCACILRQGKIREYMELLQLCKQMEREERMNSRNVKE